MKKKVLACLLTGALAIAALAGCGSTGGSDAKDSSAAKENTDGKTYTVGIAQYVDDASLNQIAQAVKDELDAKGKELGVTFDYEGHTYNGQADSTVMNQIASNLINDNVDVIVPIATPVAMVMQAATEDNQIPVVFSAVSDPVSSGLVASMDAPGSNVTGTSDMLDTASYHGLDVCSKSGYQKSRSPV